MMSLFSSFDLGLSKFYFFSFLIAFIVLPNSYNKVSLIIVFFKKIYLTVISITLPLKNKMFTEASLITLLSLFVFILMQNLISIMPYSFPLTSQMSLVLLMSAVLWFSFFLFQIVKNFKGFFSHCIPEGCPVYLVVFLFLIELISNSIRFITLSVRLTANILAGHLLMILLSKIAMANFLGSLGYLLLNTVVLFVAIIQAYIFLTMVTLYYSDVN